MDITIFLSALKCIVTAWKADYSQMENEGTVLSAQSCSCQQSTYGLISIVQA